MPWAIFARQRHDIINDLISFPENPENLPWTSTAPGLKLAGMQESNPECCRQCREGTDHTVSKWLRICPSAPTSPLKASDFEESSVTDQRQTLRRG